MNIVYKDITLGNWDVAMHLCNSYNIMGAGVARALKNKWPEVYRADCEFAELAADSQSSVFGKFSCAALSDSKRYVYNLYAMDGIGGYRSDRTRGANMSYETFEIVLNEAIVDAYQKNHSSPFRLALPHKIGCGLAGGDWRVVWDILSKAETTHTNKLLSFDLYKHQ